MQLENFNELKKCLAKADKVLVGLGEEWVLTEEEILADLKKKNKTVFFLLLHTLQSEQYRRATPFLTAYYFKNYIPEEYEKAYRNLYNLLEGKDYFLVSLTLDSYLKKYGFNANSFVNPCGTYEMLQCKNGCCENLVSSKRVLNDLEDLINGFETMINDQSGQGRVCECLDKILDVVSECYCTSCNLPMSFNTLESDKYREEGYLAKWQTYMSWLQGTLNKNLCVIEAGAGMKLPSIIRWPFEKMVYYNQKSTMFRIHEKYFQVNEELADRTLGCKCNAVRLFGKESVEASL